MKQLAAFVMSIVGLFSGAPLMAITVSLELDKYNELSEKAEKWDESQKKKEEEPPKKPEPPKRSNLRINVINDIGFKVFVTLRARPVEEAYQFIIIQGAAKEEMVTLGSIQSDPNSTFEIVDTDGAPAWFQIVTEEKTWKAKCTLKDPEKLVAKKSIDVHISKDKDNSDFAICTIHLDFAP